MIWLEILLCVLMSYIIMSLGEWIAHRYVMHRVQPFLRRVFYRHTTLHHGRYYHHFEKDPDPAAAEINIDMSVPENLAMGLPMWGPLLLIWPVAGITLALAIAAHAVLWTIIHREMHEPAGKWFSRFPLYQYFRQYHLTHHEHPGWNFNVVCPLADYLFGTYRRPQRRTLIHED